MIIIWFSCSFWLIGLLSLKDFKISWFSLISFNVTMEHLCARPSLLFSTLSVLSVQDLFSYSVILLREIYASTSILHLSQLDISSSFFDAFWENSLFQYFSLLICSLAVSILICSTSTEFFISVIIFRYLIFSIGPSSNLLLPALFFQYFPFSLRIITMLIF